MNHRPPVPQRNDDPCGFFDPQREIDGYAAAVARESEGFDLPWLGLPETVAGISVKSLTCFHLLWLEMVNSPFLYKVKAEQLVFEPHILEDVGRFLWIVSPGFEPLNQDKKSAFINAALETLGAAALKNPDEGWLPHLRELLEYIEAAFACAPRGSSGDGKRYFSYAASIADFYGSHYHLEPIRAIQQPLAITWQLMRARRRALDPKYSPALKSDELLSEYLERINQENNQAN